MRELAKKFNDLLDEVELTYEKAKKMNSLCDKQLSDCYHILEIENLNCAKAAKVTKKIKQILKDRRVWKDKVKECELILNRFATKKRIEIEPNYEYTMRTDIYNEIFNE